MSHLLPYLGLMKAKEKLDISNNETWHEQSGDNPSFSGCRSSLEPNLRNAPSPTSVLDTTVSQRHRYNSAVISTREVDRVLGKAQQSDFN